MESSGSWGSVRQDRNSTNRVIKTFSGSQDTSLTQYRHRQQILDHIDPSRRALGGRVLQYTSARDYPQKLASIAMVKQGQHNLADWKGDPQDLAPLFIPLLKAIVKLSNAGYIHGDITSPNIIHREDGSLTFIDYDYMNTNPGILDPKVADFTGMYYAWPPEIWISNRGSIDYDYFYLKHLLNKFYHPMTIEPSDFLGKFLTTKDFKGNVPSHRWVKKLVQYSNKVGTKKPRIDRNDFGKIDVYALGLVAIDKNLYEIPALRPVIEHMILPDPVERATPEKALLGWISALRDTTVRPSPPPAAATGPPWGGTVVQALMVCTILLIASVSLR